MSRLTAELAARGHSVSLITMSAAKSDRYALSPDVERIALDVESVSRNGLEKARNTARRVVALGASIRKLRPDVIVSFVETTNVIVLLANLALRVPVVVSERSDPRRHRVGRETALLRIILYGMADALVVQTQSTLGWARGLPRQPPTYVIPNAMSVPPAAGVTEVLRWKSFVLGVGRLSHEKGFDCLIRAFARARAVRSELRLVILGEGRDREKLERLCDEEKVADAVYMPGHRAAGEWLQHASMFVLSSRYEGFPNALGEAMAAALPIVATRCQSGPEEMIEHGRSGLLVPVDDVHAMAQAIRRLATEPELARTLGEGARQTAEKQFAPYTIWNRWEAVIHAARLRRRAFAES
jgi:glycosyltransferase involved in cell wall biosynthesis